MAKSKSNKVINTLEPNNTTMYHSNRITNAFFNKMSTIEIQIFVEILRTLQFEIKESKDNAKQLEMFLSPGYMNLKLAFKDVTNKRRYTEVVDALENLRQISVNMQSLEHKNYVKFTGLISGYEIPEQLKEGVAKYFYIKLDKDVATYLITIDQSHKGGIFYTKWLYEVSKQASNLYTIRLYWLACSWQKKGFFDISYKDLRNILGVPEETYPNFAHFRKRILEVSNKQLEGIADCWLDLSLKYEIKQGTKVVGFKFKVVKLMEIQESKQKNELLSKNIDSIVIRAFSFTSKDILILHDLINKHHVPFDVLIEKIIYLDEYIKANSIKNKPAFVIKSLRNEFAD